MAQPTMSSSTTGALVGTRDRCQSSPAGTAWMPGTSARTGAPGTRDIGGRKGAELLISKIIPPRKATPFLGQSALDWMLAGKVDEGSIAGRSPGQDWDAGIHFRNPFRGGSLRARHDYMPRVGFELCLPVSGMTRQIFLYSGRARDPATGTIARDHAHCPRTFMSSTIDSWKRRSQRRVAKRD